MSRGGACHGTRRTETRQLGPQNKTPSTSQNQPLFYKTKLCTFWERGRCLRSPCSYAHGEEELLQAPDLTKTAMCRVLLLGGTCSNPECSFAHNPQELRAMERPVQKPLTKPSFIASQIDTLPCTSPQRGPAAWGAEGLQGGSHVWANEAGSHLPRGELHQPQQQRRRQRQQQQQQQQLPCALSEVSTADGAALDEVTIDSGSEALSWEAAASALPVAVAAPQVTRRRKGVSLEARAAEARAAPAAVTAYRIPNQQASKSQSVLHPYTFADFDGIGLGDMVVPSRPGDTTWLPANSNRRSVQGQMIRSMLVPMLVPVSASHDGAAPLPTRNSAVSRQSEEVTNSMAGYAVQGDEIVHMLQERMRFLQTLAPEVQSRILSSAGAEQYED
mmetsp:Transcript_141734/g.359881  ORF Transcript_141734/g.359881 Transcript_141734/m.359881 type:complete len:388 (+) Transcript_141734:76-1239(+)